MVKHHIGHATIKAHSSSPQKEKQSRITFLIFDMYTKHLPRQFWSAFQLGYSFSFMSYIIKHCHSSIFAANYRNWESRN